MLFAMDLRQLLTNHAEYRIDSQASTSYLGLMLPLLPAELLYRV